MSVPKSLLGKNVQLTGISQKGKNRVRELGPIWTVIAETDRVLFAPDRPGPWLFVVPRGREHNDKSTRWIRASGDNDFTVIVQDT